MKRFYFILVCGIFIYLLECHTQIFYNLMYWGPTDVVYEMYRFGPLVLGLIVGIVIRRWLTWPFRFLRERAEIRSTSRELSARYKSARRLMDQTTRRIR